MNKRLIASLLLFVLALVIPLERSSSTTSQTARVIAIRNVTVIPVTAAPPVLNATVVINGEQIASIGPTAKIPSGARVINGTLDVRPGKQGGTIVICTVSLKHAGLSVVTEPVEKDSPHGKKIPEAASRRAKKSVRRR